VANIDHNSWQNSHSATTADFTSVDVSLLKGARQSNGNLPLVTAYHLVSGSDLRGTGISVSGLTLDCDNQSYLNPPSMGAFEYYASGGNTTLTVTGQTLTSTYTAAHITPTTFTFTNNSLTTSNTTGYLLEAGDEVPGSTNNYLDAAIITGNKLTWTGTPGSPITHGIFTGYNKNNIIKYNYLNTVPYGIVAKSGTDAGANMTYTSGGLAYNIIKNSKTGVIVKGMNGFYIYNNTFYDNLDVGNYFIRVYSNDDRSIPAPSTGVKIKNNIFYSTYQNYNIYVASGSEAGFECDYNVYYCVAGSPLFNYLGASKTWAQWQALGYDTHSIIVNPDFINTTGLVPTSRLDYGTNLGTTWATGLSTTAVWTVGNAPTTTDQNGYWQVGAIVYGSSGITIPTITTTAITDITSTTATGGGIITSDGGATVTTVGLMWSTSPNQPFPTLSTYTSVVYSSNTYTDYILIGVTANTLYYVKAYATNSFGTGYGNEITFTSLASASSHKTLMYNGKVVMFNGKVVIKE
jgi:hypothetical protein